MMFSKNAPASEYFADEQLKTRSIGRSNNPSLR
jgi:hypothetical protein